MPRDLTRRQALASGAGLALVPALSAPGQALARRDATDHFTLDVSLPEARNFEIDGEEIGETTSFSVTIQPAAIRVR